MNFIKTQFMSDIRLYASTFTNVPGRSVTINKQRANTDIIVTYMDTLGWNMAGAGDAGDWRLVVDGTARPANRFYGQNGVGWYIMPLSLMWYFQSMTAGSHTFLLQTAKYGSASETLHGWPEQDTNNFFVSAACAFDQNRLFVSHNMFRLLLFHLPLALDC
jgi:hypothetical protein